MNKGKISFILFFLFIIRSSFEDVLQKLKKLFSNQPMLIYELNKFISKSFRLPLLEQENADTFINKIRSRDEGTFKEVAKAILALKNGELSQDKLINKLEDTLFKYPDLLEEAYLFADPKKINSLNYKKTLANAYKNKDKEMRENKEGRETLRKGSIHNNPKEDLNDSNQRFNRDMSSLNKNQTTPEFLFFSSLKELFTPELYNVIIKLFHLFNEGVLSQHELVELSQPYFSRQIDLFDYLCNMTLSKKMNRRQYAIFNRPNCELDLSKSLRVSSYYELPKDYPYRISSGRNAFESSILNDRLITIPTGSEDDKNPMKKNHYEENLFKFEDQRYEVDLQIEVLSYILSVLEKFYKKLIDENINTMTYSELEKAISPSTLRFIYHFYGEVGQNTIRASLERPKEVWSVIIERIKKKIESKIEKKDEVDKTIKLSFDRFYYKSYDYRSFKFKNFDKKNNNAKAFLKEILLRKKEKLSSANINIIKGGTNSSEFFTSLNLKYHKENVEKKTMGKGKKTILLNEINLDVLEKNPSLRKKLPEIKIIFEDLDTLKLTIALIYYQLFHTSHTDTEKILEYFNPLMINLFGMNMINLVKSLKGNEFSNDKNMNYNEVIEKIKNKKDLTKEEYEEFFKMDKLTEKIKNIFEGGEEEMEESNSKDSKEKFSFFSKMDDSLNLSHSGQSHDNTKTYRDIIIFNNEDTSEKQFLFYPLKQEDDSVFYSNEHCFVFLRYIFCIYERLNKLKEYSENTEENKTENKNISKSLRSKSSSIKNSQQLNIQHSHSHSQSNTECTPEVFKNYFIIYKALLHKKLENPTIYEELCRDILGNESYFLFNMDKLVSLAIRNMATIVNDSLSKEVLNLFKFEMCRKTKPNEKLYFAHYLQLLDNNSSNNFRILINRRLSIMCIHLMDLPNEQNKKDYYDQFKEFVTKTLQDAYTQLYEGNVSDDDPFNIFLIRNQKAVKERKGKTPSFCENNLIFKFDYATKKLQYLCSGCDCIIRSKNEIKTEDKKKTQIKKNICFTKWINQKIKEKK
ncbi:MAG: hypothetical protein MJ252_18215 [archaeon]|nr:hypothetical protein [archaeon]